MSQSDRPDRPGASARGTRRGGRRFALLLLGWAVLTVAVFLAVFRYTQTLARLWNYDIENLALQFGLYFGIYVVLTGFALVVIPWLPLGLKRENELRLAFLAGATLSLIVAIYQSRFGPMSFLNYLVVGLLGTFVAALVATRRHYGLVEVIARPAAAVIEEVRRGHAGIELAPRPYDPLKRAIDALLALVIIVVSLPISVPLVLALWLQDPGPLLVAKVTVRRGGESFGQLKLRTMIKDAEGATGPVPASPDDGRVTRLGGLLRRTHLDELPQMWNIAKGDMSLVGPRPERTVFVQRHLRTIPGYAERHVVRPGLAGMAQVYGDYYSTPREKLRYDRLYIRRRSLDLDAHLFGAALFIAFLGVRPGARHRRRERARAREEGRRFDRAYRALRGEAPAEAPEEAPEEAP